MESSAEVKPNILKPNPAAAQELRRLAAQAEASTETAAAEQALKAVILLPDSLGQT